jgi:predicted Zn-dependent protease
MIISRWNYSSSRKTDRYPAACCGEVHSDSVEIQSSINIENINDSIINLPGYYVYIATFPDLNTDTVNAVAASISHTYGIEVKIINVGSVEYRDNIRDKQEEIYDSIIADVTSKNSKDSIINFLTRIGLTEGDLQTREGKKIFSYHLLNGTETGLQQWELIEMTQNQYSGDALLNQLKNNFANYNNDPRCLGIVGITRQDIYENDYNFLFGWTQKKWGIISYARFSLGEPTPTYEQFERRTMMQSLSSVGFVIGIPRCTSPNCVRAYPNSLAEMDKKSMELCAECKTNLQDVYSTLE